MRVECVSEGAPARFCKVERIKRSAIALLSIVKTYSPVIVGWMQDLCEQQKCDDREVRLGGNLKDSPLNCEEGCPSLGRI
jgi:hypothetical protein